MSPWHMALVATILAVNSPFCESPTFSFRFHNQSDTDVWIASRSPLGEPPDDRLLWVEAPAGEVVTVAGGRGEPKCGDYGIMLVATESDADAVIDQRNLEEHPWCPDDAVWQWSGPGDYD